MEFSPLLNRLIEGLRCLPGVGPKTAQRMAFQLLEHNRDAGKQLANVLIDAIDHIGHCNACRTLTESDICSICSNNKRDQHKLCVVESPADVYAIEQSTHYTGLYFVLMGHLSPIDGIGPNDLGLDRFQERLKQNTINEVILATNPTIEGEATAHYVAEIIRAQGIIATRLAHGIPIGGELEYIDGGTLLHAFNGRLEI